MVGSAYNREIAILSKNTLPAAYLLMVGVPVLGLFGILDAGRSISAPISIGGKWRVAFDAAGCPSPPGSILQQIAFDITQSGNEARITLEDGLATTLEATVNGHTLTARELTAAIAGPARARTLEGKVEYAGCAPVAFKAVRQANAERGE